MNRLMLGSFKAVWSEQKLFWDPEINLLGLIGVDRVMILRVYITCNKSIKECQKQCFFCTRSEKKCLCLLFYGIVLVSENAYNATHVNLVNYLSPPLQ